MDVREKMLDRKHSSAKAEAVRKCVGFGELQLV